MLIFYVVGNDFNMYWACVLNFLWGIQDSGVNTFTNCVLGFQFESKTVPFSIFYLFQSFSCFLFISLNSMVTTQLANLIYAVVLAFFAVFSWLLFLWKFELKPTTPVKQSAESFKIKQDD